jgi:hypothetical protein
MLFVRIESYCDAAMFRTDISKTLICPKTRSSRISTGGEAGYLVVVSA